MKKVYGSKIVFILVTWGIIYFWKESFVNHFEVRGFSVGHTIEMDLLALFIFLILLRSILWPLWTYNERYFEKWGFINISSRQKYSWKQVVVVQSIYGPVYTPSAIYQVFVYRSKLVFQINFFNTGNYLRVLADIVRLSKLNNPKVHIEPEVLKIVRNSFLMKLITLIN